MIRDRKMYVVPTPFRLVEGVAHACTLVLPSKAGVGREFVHVGDLVRVEADELIVGYTFDLKANAIAPKRVRNPSAGVKHAFHAWRLKGSKTAEVSMRASGNGVSRGAGEAEEDE
jgi:hypothetical protein